eukprot:g71391.t1
MRVWLWPAESAEKFVEAARNGELDRVRELLAQRADVESRGRWNYTALIETGCNGRTDTLPRRSSPRAPTSTPQTR